MAEVNINGTIYTIVDGIVIAGIDSSGYAIRAGMAGECYLMDLAIVECKAMLTNVNLQCAGK